MRTLGFRLKYENEDVFDVISSELQENISDGVQIDDAFNQISIGFEKDINEENVPVIFNALKALCNMYFPKSTVEVNNTDAFDLFSGNKHITIKYPECAFQTVSQTSDFMFKLYRMFYGRLFVIFGHSVPLLGERDFNFITKYHSRLTIDSGMSDVIKYFIKPFFTTEDRQRKAFEEFTMMPFEGWCACGAYYVAVHHFNNKYSEIIDITNRAYEYIGMQIKPNDFYIGIAQPGFSRYKREELDAEVSKKLFSDMRIKRIVMSPFGERTDDYVNVVMTLSDPYFVKKRNIFLVVYAHFIMQKDTPIDQMIEKFIEKVCVE